MPQSQSCNQGGSYLSSHLFSQRDRLLPLSLREIQKTFFFKSSSGVQKSKRMKPRQLGKYCNFLLIFESTVLCFCTAVRYLEKLKENLIFPSHLQDQQYLDPRLVLKAHHHENYLLGSGSCWHYCNNATLGQVSIFKGRST